MARRRPAAVGILGVLNIIFGSIGLLFGCCGGLNMLFWYNLQSQSVGPHQPALDLGRDMMDFLQRELPIYGGYTYGSLVVNLLMSAVLLAAGIGLLNRQNWAHITCIVYSILNMVLLLVEVIFRVFFVMPAMERWQADYQRRYPHLFQVNTPYLSITFAQIVNVIVNLALIVYAVVLLINMLLPSVTAWFSPRPKFDGYEDDFDDTRRFRRDWDD